MGLPNDDLEPVLLKVHSLMEKQKEISEERLGNEPPPKFIQPLFAITYLEIAVAPSQGNFPFE